MAVLRGAHVFKVGIMGAPMSKMNSNSWQELMSFFFVQYNSVLVCVHDTNWSKISKPLYNHLFEGLRAGDVVSVYADLDGHCLKGTATCYSNQKLFVGNGVAHVSRSDLFNSQTLQR